MNARNTLLAALSMASSIVMAQPSSQPQPQAGQQIRPGAQSETPSSSSGESASPASASPSPSDEQRQFQPQSAPYPMTQLEPKTKNGFTYLCGGVGADETAQMKQAARDYDMALTFATRKGNYLANVNVNIKNARGDAELQAACDGPIMLVDVPKGGTYRIRAEAAGYTLNKTASVQAKRRQQAALVLTWPQQVAEAAEVGTTSSGSSGNAGSSKSDKGTR